VIQLTRDRGAIPPMFQKAGRKARLVKLVKSWLAAGAGGKPALDPAYWKLAKEQLRKESAGKCAYCEGQVAAVSHGDVEHFRPKAIYWWLAYCWENYLYACQVCNEVYKKDRFPTAGKRLPAPRRPARATAGQIAALADSLIPDPLDAAAVAALAAACRAEEADLPNPYEEDPEQLFAWEADPVLKEVRLVPAKGTARARRAVMAAEALFGLNREDHMRLRYAVYRQASAFQAALGAIQDPAVARQTEEALAGLRDSRATYAAVARFFART